MWILKSLYFKKYPIYFVMKYSMAFFFFTFYKNSRKLLRNPLLNSRWNTSNRVQNGYHLLLIAPSADNCLELLKHSNVAFKISFVDKVSFLMH